MNSDMHPGADAPGTSPAMAQGPAPQAEEGPVVPQVAIRKNDWVVLVKFIHHVDELDGTKMWVTKLGGSRVKRDIMQVVRDNLGVIPEPARSARFRVGSTMNIKVQGMRQNRDRPIIAGIFNKEGVQIGKPMYLSLFNYFNSYPLEYEEAVSEESGSQARDVAADLTAKLEEYPRALKWFKATENVVLDEEGNEAVLRETLARAMDGLVVVVVEGPVGSSAEEEVARLLRSIEDLIG